jgi:hypothetical protein
MGYRDELTKERRRNRNFPPTAADMSVTVGKIKELARHFRGEGGVPAAFRDLSGWPRTAFSRSDTIFMRRMSGGCPLYRRKRKAPPSASTSPPPIITKTPRS